MWLQLIVPLTREDQYNLDVHSIFPPFKRALVHGWSRSRDHFPVLEPRSYSEFTFLKRYLTGIAIWLSVNICIHPANRCLLYVWSFFDHPFLHTIILNRFDPCHVALCQESDQTSSNWATENGCFSCSYQITLGYNFFMPMIEAAKIGGPNYEKARDDFPKRAIKGPVVDWFWKSGLLPRWNRGLISPIEGKPVNWSRIPPWHCGSRFLGARGYTTAAAHAFAGLCAFGLGRETWHGFDRWTGHGASMFVARLPIKMWEFLILRPTWVLLEFLLLVIYEFGWTWLVHVCKYTHSKCLYTHSNGFWTPSLGSLSATLEKWCSLAQLEKPFRSLR